ncbi:MAG: anthranilate phosphoribosyltransferase [bacterium]|nr:anthranilate phosphoribosyltransferase [bacterium]
MIKEALSKVVQRQDLTKDEAVAVMNEIMSGEATPAQIAGFITALRMKGETVDEITGGAMVMREKATKIKVEGEVVNTNGIVDTHGIVDTCGTGGDGLHTFNISTISAFVIAGAGIKVAKHGNKSVSSKCGSADLLMNFGVNIEVSKEVVERCLKEIGIGFLFAPLLHSAMKYAIGPRREIGIRTIFNILGPLTNPAGANRQLLGVYDGNLTETLAGVLKNLGSKRAFIVYGEEGLDEVSICGRTKISELKENGDIATYWISPEDFGFRRANLDEIKGGEWQRNVEMALEVLKGGDGPRREIVLLNSAYGIMAGGKANTVLEGIELAGKSIDSGAALEKLEKLKEITSTCE